jgi:hypothetical protein
MTTDEEPGPGPAVRPPAPLGPSAGRAGRRRRLHGALSWLGVALLLGFFAVLIALEFHLL